MWSAHLCIGILTEGKSRALNAVSVEQRAIYLQGERLLRGGGYFGTTEDSEHMHWRDGKQVPKTMCEHPQSLMLPHSPSTYIPSVLRLDKHLRARRGIVSASRIMRNGHKNGTFSILIVHTWQRIDSWCVSALCSGSQYIEYLRMDLIVWVIVANHSGLWMVRPQIQTLRRF